MGERDLSCVLTVRYAFPGRFGSSSARRPNHCCRRTGRSHVSGEKRRTRVRSGILKEVETDNRIVVFDGLCNLCSGGARWLEDHQARPPFRLVPMQSELGRTLLAGHGYDPEDPLTFLVLDGDKCLTQSDAWIHLVALARPRLQIVNAARVIPRP